jgi:hypothetical protein
MHASVRRIIVMCLAAAVFPRTGAGQPSPRDNGNGNGNVSFLAAPGNEIVGVRTRLIVPVRPAKPQTPPHGTLFLWPGLQSRPEDTNFWPIGNGVLQSVLTWRPSCAPGDRPNDEDAWWISAQYVNTDGNYMNYQGCQGGWIMSASHRDTLLISMSLYRSIWTQTVLNLKTNKSVGFHASLADQAQGIARFKIEPWDGAMSPDLEFLETIIDFARPHSDNCRLDEKRHDDTVTAAILIDHGQSCYIEKMILRGSGAPQSARRHPAFH